MGPDKSITGDDAVVAGVTAFSVVAASAAAASACENVAAARLWMHPRKLLQVHLPAPSSAFLFPFLIAQQEYSREGRMGSAPPYHPRACIHLTWRIESTRGGGHGIRLPCRPRACARSLDNAARARERGAYKIRPLRHSRACTRPMWHSERMRARKHIGSTPPAGRVIVPALDGAARAYKKGTRAICLASSARLYPP